ncbi:hypothetical protein L227DRAFT_573104 [Lentinus tigrinus ALCF2SS1-6]|uniref:Uncharacterized protein n=1 Tax=Lentinus tigrinus ALCF2SS1-6 TaxID=1328759 RepID=A0A5C2SH11_9APHY|nr:hypothetical protein L227DRAFT_573104 [Lentinus tigrinus ALCF2SS1-6]
MGSSPRPLDFVSRAIALLSSSPALRTYRLRLLSVLAPVSCRSLNSSSPRTAPSSQPTNHSPPCSMFSHCLSRSHMLLSPPTSHFSSFSRVPLRVRKVLRLPDPVPSRPPAFGADDHDRRTRNARIHTI